MAEARRREDRFLCFTYLMILLPNAMATICLLVVQPNMIQQVFTFIYRILAADSKVKGIAELPKVRMLEGGVPEIDYRQSGGFVPMGKKEKADDVPAMLSKNEFVMTADAVRGMGDGNVEKGAQRMYDQMRQLESRVV